MTEVQCFSKYTRNVFLLKVKTNLFNHLRQKPGYEGGDTNSC